MVCYSYQDYLIQIITAHLFLIQKALVVFVSFAFYATNVDSYIYRNGSSFLILSVRPSAAVVSQGEILRPNTDLSIKDVMVICVFFSPFQIMQLCAVISLHIRQQQENHHS